MALREGSWGPRQIDFSPRLTYNADKPLGTVRDVSPWTPGFCPGQGQESGCAPLTRGRHADGAPVDVLRPAEERRPPRSRLFVREAASDAPPTGGQILHHGLWLSDGGANGSLRSRCLLRGAPLSRVAECHSPRFLRPSHANAEHHHRLNPYRHRIPAGFEAPQSINAHHTPGR